jgi:hypothetical protein
LDKYRKQGGPLKCKQCVQLAEEEERKQAAAKRAAAGNTPNDQDGETRTCAGCNKPLEFACYNKNQWNKGEGKSKCRACVEKAVAEEAKQQASSKQAKLQAAREKAAQANAKGNVADILKAESELSALEAEQVTGLKPVKMGRGGGGRGRGRSSGGSGRGGGRGRK